MFLSLYYWNLLQICTLGSSQFTFIAVVRGCLLWAKYSAEAKGGSPLEPSLQSSGENYCKARCENHSSCYARCHTFQWNTREHPEFFDCLRVKLAFWRHLNIPQKFIPHILTLNEIEMEFVVKEHQCNKNALR